MPGTPEPPHRQALRALAVEAATTRAALAELVLHDPDGVDRVVPLAQSWQDMEGRPGVRIYHVPHPAGEAGLYLAVCCIAPGTEFSGGFVDDSQLIGLLDGQVECNGRTYRRGEFLWLAPGQPTTWRVTGNYLGVILYNVPPHDIDPDLFQPLPPNLHAQAT